MSDADKVQARPIVTGKSQDVFNDLCTVRRYDVLEFIVDGELKKRLAARIDFGERKYGSRLMTYNGREVLVDAEQELLDGIQYTHQGVMEGYRIRHIRDLLISGAEALIEYRRLHT